MAWRLSHLIQLVLLSWGTFMLISFRFIGQMDNSVPPTDYDRDTLNFGNANLHQKFILRVNNTCIAKAAERIEALEKEIRKLKPPKARNPQLILPLSPPPKFVHSSEQQHLYAGSNESFQPIESHTDLKTSLIQRDTLELWFFIRSELKKMEVKDGALKILRKDFFDRWKYLYGQMEAISDRNAGRKEVLQNLASEIQLRIEKLQNPADCKKASKLVCDLNKRCGFGCLLHHLTYCFIYAYELNRTFIVDASGYRYSKSGWSSTFKKLSNTCLHGDYGDTIRMPIIDSLTNQMPKSLPPAVPSEYHDKLLELHGNPSVWWIGQFVHYLMRYNDDMLRDIAFQQAAMDFADYVVGIHVRRTDKIAHEAKLHRLEEYMEWVEEHYLIQEAIRGSMKRRLFIATDDSSVFKEARQRYPKYVVLGDEKVAESAGVDSRYTYGALRGLLKDIYFLSKTNYLVCTFSSQVCRVAYELMQAEHGDWEDRFHSLDDSYYFGGGYARETTVIIDHRGPPGIDLRVGDTVSIAGNHWDGWSKGTNLRTLKTGLFPSFKVKHSFRTW